MRQHVADHSGAFDLAEPPPCSRRWACVGRRSRSKNVVGVVAQLAQVRPQWDTWVSPAHVGPPLVFRSCPPEPDRAVVDECPPSPFLQNRTKNSSSGQHGREVEGVVEPVRVDVTAARAGTWAQESARSAPETVEIGRAGSAGPARLQRPTPRGSAPGGACSLGERPHSSPRSRCRCRSRRSIEQRQRLADEPVLTTPDGIAMGTWNWDCSRRCSLWIALAGGDLPRGSCRNRDVAL